MGPSAVVKSKWELNRACWCVLIICWLCVQSSEPARILVFLPMPWKSHHFVYQTVINALASRGHEVDYLTGVPMKNPPDNVKQLIIEDKLSEIMGRLQPEALDETFAPKLHWMFRSQINAAIEDVYRTQPAITELFTSDKTYDIVISEAQLDQEINAVWAHKFNAIYVDLLVIGEVAFAQELQGLPMNPSYQVDFTTTNTEEMGFLHRLENAISYGCSLAIHYFKLREMQALADEVARYPGWESRPPLRQLAADAALVLVNAHHATGHSIPKAPHVKEIGGMTLFGSTDLPQDLKAFMDNAEEGVVYFSLGSLIDMHEFTKDGKIDEILDVFKKLKQRVIFKWAGENLPVVDDPNVLIQRWWPQLGILAHKNTRVFITHGGLQSTMETANFGVPIIGIPMFGDQPKNIKFMVSKGCGVEVHKKNFTGVALKWAIDEVLSNPRYKEVMTRRSKLIKDSPMEPLEEAVYWIEYVLKHGKVLQPASLHMPFYQIYLLDVAAVLLAALASLCLICSKSIKLMFKLARVSQTPKVNKRNKKNE